MVSGQNTDHGHQPLAINSSSPIAPHPLLIADHSSLLTHHWSLVTTTKIWYSRIEDEIGIEGTLDLLLQTDVFGRQFEGQQVLFHKADAMLPGNRAPHGKDQLEDGLIP